MLIFANSYQRGAAKCLRMYADGDCKSCYRVYDVIVVSTAVN
jgi:hypothetical protein